MDFYRGKQHHDSNVAFMTAVPSGSQLDIPKMNRCEIPHAEGAERFLAGRVPPRLNKDYRPKFRGYTFGYPTYKKDAYSRHWMNLQDIFAENNPIIEASTYFCKGMFIFTTYFVLKERVTTSMTGLQEHKGHMNNDFYGKGFFKNALTRELGHHVKKGFVFTCGYVFFRVLERYFKYVCKKRLRELREQSNG